MVEDVCLYLSDREKGLFKNFPYMAQASKDM